MAIGAGDLKDRWTFQQRAEDDSGDRRGKWEDGFTVWTKVTWLIGSEAVMQDRLTGLQPVVLSVRASSMTREITPAWRALDSRQPGREANITGVAPSRTPGFIDILAVIGGAQG